MSIKEFEECFISDTSIYFKEVIRNDLYYELELLDNNNIKKIIFDKDCDFNNIIESKFLPNNLTHLYLNSKFNSEIELIPSLTHLYFGSMFNKEINLLKINCLTHLSLGFSFNKNLILPNTLLYLELGCNNQYIIDNIPNSVKTLKLINHFNLELNNLPNSIESIIFITDLEHYCYNYNYKYNKELNNLPNSVKYLYLPCDYKLLIKRFPKNLIKIYCNRNYKYLIYLEDYEIEFI